MHRYYVCKLSGILDHSFKRNQVQNFEYIPDRKMVKYKTALTRVISQYTDAGLSIRCIFSDQIFQPVLQHFKEANPSIDFNLTNSIEHVPKQMNCSLDTIQKAKCQSEGEKN